VVNVLIRLALVTSPSIHVDWMRTCLLKTSVRGNGSSDIALICHVRHEQRRGRVARLGVPERVCSTKGRPPLSVESDQDERIRLVPSGPRHLSSG
jgi:hypothetical protein